MTSLTLDGVDMYQIDQAMERYDRICFWMGDIATPAEIQAAHEALQVEDAKIAEIVRRKWWDNAIQDVIESEEEDDKLT